MRVLFAAHCERQCHLARRGYFDLDAATINYARRADGNVFTFDKDAVFRLDNLAPCEEAFAAQGEWPVWNLDGGSYFVLLRQSYRSVPAGVQRDISAALASADPERIVATFATAPTRM